MARFFPIAIALLFLSAVANTANTTPISPDETVLPTETDPEIRTFDHPQAIYHPKRAARGQLFLLLTGTNGADPFAQRLSTNASLLGYHVIQPMYPNDVAASVCRNDKDPEAFAKFRWAIIEGGESPHLRHPIPRTESIEHRTIKLLEYLARKHPGKEWGQFLQSGQIVWDKVVAGGMSQGGGHAALIATRHRVARVVCFGSPKDYSIALHAPARWYGKSETPATRYFAFNNTHDKQGCDYDQELEILAKLGVSQVAGTADVDAESPPYHGAHALFTSWPGPDQAIDSIPAHTSVLDDALIGSDGRARFLPVWSYMLTAPTSRN